ncbi:50S ribosomal protein L35 [Candidatus Azambacteria bacterium]|nr:50S ribosomal protein L35 [Candidatus Azambacteria bacterium]
MGKLKTNKAILSRLKITGKKKLVRLTSNRSHFNTKTSGKQRRLKRRSLSVDRADTKMFKKFLPYN